MESSDVRRKLEDDESNYKRNRYDNATRSPTSNPLIEQENSRFIKDQRQQTRATVQQQDESLDVLGQSVDRLGQIARDVNQEVREQNVMLDGLERDIDEGQSQMNVVQEALSKLLRTKDGCQIWTIVALTLILILLSKYSFNSFPIKLTLPNCF